MGKPEERPYNEETPVGPKRFSEYAQSKYEGDRVVWELRRERSLPVVVLYPAAILGAGDPKATGQYIRDLRRSPRSVATAYIPRTTSCRVREMST